MRLEDLACPPQAGTQRTDRPTLGHDIDAHALALSQGRAMPVPWQRYVSQVTGELDEHGRRHYLTCIIEVPRQQGKTTWVHAKLTQSSRRGPGRTTVYTAQDRQAARFKLIDEFCDGVLAMNPLYARKHRARRSNGSEAVRWVDTAAARSIIAVIATTDTAGHGLTRVDDVVLDEAFSHRDLGIINNVMPTLTVAPDPQITITSTVGDGTDGLLQHYEEVGAASLLDPDTRIAYFRWAADDDDDRDDPAVWARVMPSLGHHVTVDRIKAIRASMADAEFDRAYLNRRPRLVDTSALDLVAWHDAARLADRVPTGPIVIVIDIAIDRTHATIAAVGPDPDDPSRLAMIVDRRPGTGWVVDTVVARAADRDVRAIYADRRAGCGGIIDTAAGRGLTITEIGAADVVSWHGTFVDELAARRIVHAAQPVLDDAAAAARTRPIGDARVWAKLVAYTDLAADLAPLNAVTLAVGAHRSLWPLGANPRSIT